MRKKRPAEKTDVRPFDSRALKSIVDTFQFNLPESKVLELFGGSGRFSWEALRFNPARIVVVEKHYAVFLELENRFKSVPIVQIVFGDAVEFIKSCPEKFQIIVADPPFGWWSTMSLLDFIELCATCAALESILLVKYPSKMIILGHEKSKHWQVLKTAVHGESSFIYFKHKSVECK